LKIENFVDDFKQLEVSKDFDGGLYFNFKKKFQADLFTLRVFTEMFKNTVLIPVGVSVFGNEVILSFIERYEI
jgi:hypothetical protein